MHMIFFLFPPPNIPIVLSVLFITIIKNNNDWSKICVFWYEQLVYKSVRVAINRLEILPPITIPIVKTQKFVENYHENLS